MQRQEGRVADCSLTLLNLYVGPFEIYKLNVESTTSLQQNASRQIITIPLPMD